MGVTSLLSNVMHAGAAASGAPLSMANVALCLAFLLLGLLVSGTCRARCSGAARAEGGREGGHRAADKNLTQSSSPSFPHFSPQLPRPKWLERSATAAAFASPLFRVSRRVEAAVVCCFFRHSRAEW